MKFLLQIIIILALIVFQVSVYPYFHIYNAFPNLILVIILIISILKGYKQGLLWIIFGGFLLDIYSYNNPVGISILALLLIAYLSAKLSQNIFQKNSIYSIIIIGIEGTLIYQLLIVLTLAVIGVEFQFGFFQVLFQVIYNLIILIPLFWLIKKVSFNALS